MNFANIDVKKYITEKGYTQKQIAEKLGITQEWFCRMLKKELADEEKQAVMMAIDGDLRLWRKRHRTFPQDKIKQVREEIQKLVDMCGSDTVADLNMKSGLGLALEKIDKLIESEDKK